jgi:hypothetical protein
MGAIEAQAVCLRTTELPEEVRMDGVNSTKFGTHMAESVAIERRG